MNRFFQICTLLFLLGWMLWPARAHALGVQAVKLTPQGPNTQVTVTFDAKPTSYTAFLLSDPWRIAIDLPPFTWQAGKTSRPPHSIVTGIRQGLLQPGISRIVFDLQAPAVLKSVVPSPKGTRLILLLAPAKAITLGGNSPLFKSPPPAETVAADVDSEKPPMDQPDAAAPKSAKPQIGAIVMAPDKHPGITPAAPPAKPLIIIDPGHGGVDPGTAGPDGIVEKNVTLAVAKVLRDQLTASGHYTVMLTREDDTYLYLPQRVAFARKNHGDLFISLHADSSPNGEGARGASIYTLSETASDAETAKLAAKENRADQVAGMDLSGQDDDVAGILVDLAMRNTMNQSQFLAATVAGNLQGHDIPLLERPRRAAGFAVLKDPDVPSILVEMGFLSNPQQAQSLVDPAFQHQLAAALNASLDAYFKKIRAEARP